jgi:hypothetical protein
MHRPGYVQGGQEAKRGYLLLGVYHRRIPGSTGSLKGLQIRTQEINSKEQKITNKMLTGNYKK